MKDFLKKAASSFSLKQGSQEISRLCSPFLRSMGFNNFYYVRIYKTGELIYLTNHVNFIMDYWEAGLPLCTGFDQPPNDLQNTVVLWENKLDSEILEFAHLKKCYNGFSIIERYYDRLQFTSFLRKTAGENPYEFYLENLTKLRTWLRNFEIKHAKLIQHAEKNPMLLPEDYLSPQKTSFYPKKTFPLSFNHIKLKISFRELDVLSLYAKGFTGSYIAELLGISQRTVETHLCAVKDMFGISTKDNLAALSYACPLLQSYAPRLK